jgi:hypothetical protein
MSKRFDSWKSTQLYFLILNLLIGSSLLISGCAGHGLVIRGDITAGLASTSFSGAPGQTVTQTLSVTNKTASALGLDISADCTTLSSQLTPSPSQVNLASFSSTQVVMPFTIPSTAKPGDVFRCSCAVNKQTTVEGDLDWTVYVTKPTTGTFTVSPNYSIATQLSLVSNGNATATVTITPSGGFTGPVSIAVTTTDAGVTPTKNPVTVNVGSGPASTGVTLHWDGKGTSVGGLCTLTATAGTITQTASFAYQGG